MPRLKLTQPSIAVLEVPAGQRKIDYFDTEVKGLMLEVRQSGKTYYLRYKNERGSTHQKKLARADVLKVTEARKLAIEKLALIAMGKDPFAEQQTKKEVPTLENFAMSSYLTHIKSYKRSWKTDLSHLKTHIFPALGKLHLDEVKRHQVVELTSTLRQTRKPSTTNRVLVLLRYIFNCAIKWEVPGATANPTSGIKLYPENNKVERYLTEAEVKRLFVALDSSSNPQLKYIVSILLLTGARKREVLDARWEDFDLERRIWTVPVNKTGKPRHIPISDGLMNLLAQIPRPRAHGWVVPNPDTLLPYTSITYAWDKACDEADMPELRIHDLRHSFASFLINAGRSLYEVQRILGHTKITTTQRYAHLSQESLLSAADVTASFVPLVRSVAPKQLNSH